MIPSVGNQQVSPVRVMNSEYPALESPLDFAEGGWASVSTRRKDARGILQPIDRGGLPSGGTRAGIGWSLRAASRAESRMRGWQLELKPLGTAVHEGHQQKASPVEPAVRTWRGMAERAGFEPATRLLAL